MRRFRFLEGPRFLRCRISRLGLPLLIASWVGSALAASPCDVAPEIAAISIGGLYRGDLPILVVGDRIWIPAGALKPDETSYSVGQSQCGVQGADQTYLELSPALDVYYDPNELTLTVEAAATLLPGGVLDFAGSFGKALPSLPALTAAGRFDLVRDAGEALGGSVGTSLGAQSGRYRGQADLDLSGSLANGGLQNAQLLGTLSGEAAVNQTWTVGAVLGVQNRWATATTPNSFGLSPRFNGLNVSAHSAQGTLVPELTLDLPLESVVTLLFEERQIARFRAPAGVFRLRNLPFPVQQGELLAFVQDARGTRVITVPFSSSQLDLSEGAYAAQAQVGLEGFRVIGRASGAYGLASGLTVQGRTQLTADQQSLSLSLGLPLGPGRGRVGGSVSRAAQAGLDGGLNFGYAASRGALAYVLDLNVPAKLPLSPSASLGLSYNTARLQSSLTGQYDFGVREGSVKASTTYQVTPQWTLRTQANYQGAGRYGAGLGLTYHFENGVDVGAGISASTLQGAQVSASPALRASLSASYGQQQVQLYGPNVFGISYANFGVWPVSVSADQLGNFSASGDIGVTYVAGRLIRGVSTQGVSLLVRTGIPGLPLRLSGSRSQRADARGDVLFTDLPAGANVVVQVDASRLSFETEITDSEQPLKLDVASVSLFDWTGNFKQRRWVRFVFADGSPAAYATVKIGEQVYNTDLDGNVLIDAKLLAGTPVTVRSETGDRACTLTLDASEEQRCR